MGKETDLLLDPDTGDLMVSKERDQKGLITQGITLGDVTWQNQALILQMSKGELKEYPLLGVSIKEMINDHDISGWKREIKLQLNADSMQVSEVDLSIQTGKLIIDASYS